MKIKELYKEEGKKSLIDLIKKGDQKAWNLIIEEYYNGLLAYISSMVKEKETAKEILQSVLTKFWKKREDININISIKSYIYRMARNTTLNYIKRKKIETDYQITLKTKANKYENSTEEDFHYHQTKEFLYQAIEKLPLLSKECFKLSRFSGMTYKEISDTLSISVRSVQHQIAVALKKLKEKLEQRNDLFLSLNQKE